MTLPLLLGRLPPRWRWTIHNVIAHPLSEALYQLGLDAFSRRVHDLTIPEVTE